MPDLELTTAVTRGENTNPGSAMFRFRVSFLLALTGSVLPRAALSQNIVPDRPVLAESSLTVGKGRVQIEGGVVFDKTKTEGTDLKNFSTPFLFRIGFADTWEARLESDWYGRSTESLGASGTTNNGVSDIALGVKWAFFAPETGNAPAMATLVHVEFPTGSAEFRGDGARPSLRVTLEWALEGDWGIGVMPGILLDQMGDERFASGIFGAVVGKGFGDSFGAFVEVGFQQIAKDEQGGNVGFVDFGVTFLLNPRWQLDTAAAVGITPQAVDYGLTFGLSGLFAG